MLAQYNDYGYGDEVSFQRGGQDGQEGGPGGDMSSKGGKKGGKPGMTPMQMAFFLVPVGDLYVYYKANDEFTTDSWTTVKNVALAGGVAKIVGLAAGMFMNMRSMAKMVPMVSAVQEAASLYLISAADDGDKNVYYGITGANFVVSAAISAMSNGKKNKKPSMGGDKGGRPEGGPPGGDSYGGDYGYY